MNLNPYIIPHIKISSKWIRNLNIKPKTVRLLEETRGENTVNCMLKKDFLYITQKQGTYKKN